MLQIREQICVFADLQDGDTSRNNKMLVYFLKSSTLNRHTKAYNKGKTRPPIGDYPLLVPNKIMYGVPIYSCISSMQSVHMVYIILYCRYPSIYCCRINISMSNNYHA